MPPIKCPITGCPFVTPEGYHDKEDANFLNAHIVSAHNDLPSATALTSQVPPQPCPSQTPPHEQGYAVAYGHNLQPHGYGAAAYGHNPHPHGHAAATYGHNPQPQGYDAAAYGHNPQPQGYGAAAYGHNPQPHGYAIAYGHHPQPHGYGATYGHSRPGQKPVKHRGHPHSYYGAGASQFPHGSPSAPANYSNCVFNTNNITYQNNYTAINSNIEHFGPTMVKNTNIENLKIQNINIDKVSVELGGQKEEVKKFVGVLGEENATEDNLQKFINLKNENKFQLPTVSKMTRSTCLVKYMRPGLHGDGGKRWHGTGFITTLPDFNGAVLFSAGHNFEDDGKLLDDFQNFTFIFNNGPGVLDPSKPTDDADEKNIITKTIENFMREFPCTAVINYSGKKLIKKNNQPAVLSHHHDKDLDYFALILEGDRAQQNLREQNLELLQVAPEFDLKNCSGDPVFIFGHPGLTKCPCCKGKCSCEAANPPCNCEPKCHHPACSCRHPLRFSYGHANKEKIKNNIYYKLDTKEGNSGAPITGKYYTVVGIHVSDDKKREQYNKAQSLLAVLKDLSTSEEDPKTKKLLEGLKHILRL